MGLQSILSFLFENLTQSSAQPVLPYIVFVSSNRWARHDPQLSLCVKSDSIIISHFSHRFVCFLLQEGKKLGDKSAARFRILILSAEMLCDLLPSYTFNHVAPFLWVHACTSPPPFQTGFMRSIHSIFVQIWKENKFRWSWCIICFKENPDPWSTCCIIFLWKENPDPWRTCCTILLLQGKSGSVMYLWPHLLQRKSRAMNEVPAASFWSKENLDPCFPFKHRCKNLSTKILQTLITR